MTHWNHKYRPHHKHHTRFLSDRQEMAGWDELSIKEVDHTPYNKTSSIDGNCVGYFDVSRHTSGDAEMLQFKMTEQTKHASGRDVERVIMMSVPREFAEAFARFILTGMAK